MDRQQVTAEEVTATWRDGDGAEHTVTYRAGDKVVPVSETEMRRYERGFNGDVLFGEIAVIYAGVDVPLAVRWTDAAGLYPWVTCLPPRMVRPAG
jgi:hypothetical protein